MDKILINVYRLLGPCRDGCRPLAKIVMLQNYCHQKWSVHKIWARN